MTAQGSTEADPRLPGARVSKSSTMCAKCAGSASTAPSPRYLIGFVGLLPSMRCKARFAVPEKVKEQSRWLPLRLRWCARRDTPGAPLSQGRRDDLSSQMGARTVAQATSYGLPVRNSRHAAGPLIRTKGSARDADDDSGAASKQGLCLTRSVAETPQEREHNSLSRGALNLHPPPCAAARSCEARRSGRPEPWAAWVTSYEGRSGMGQLPHNATILDGVP